MANSENSARNRLIVFADFLLREIDSFRVSGEHRICVAFHERCLTGNPVSLQLLLRVSQFLPLRQSRRSKAERLGDVLHSMFRILGLEFDQLPTSTESLSSRLRSSIRLAHGANSAWHSSLPDLPCVRILIAAGPPQIVSNPHYRTHRVDKNLSQLCIRIIILCKGLAHSGDDFSRAKGTRYIDFWDWNVEQLQEMQRAKAIVPGQAMHDQIGLISNGTCQCTNIIPNIRPRIFRA